MKKKNETKRLKRWGEQNWRDVRRRERHARKWERRKLAKTRKREKIKNVGSSLSHSSNFALALSRVEIAQNIRPRGDIKTFIIRPLQGIFVIRPKHALGKKYMYVYEIRLRQQKQIVISYLAFSSLRVDYQLVRWQNNITEFSTRRSYKVNTWLSGCDIRWGQIHMFEMRYMESVCFTLCRCTTCSVFVCHRFSYNQT